MNTSATAAVGMYEGDLNGYQDRIKQHVHKRPIQHHISSQQLQCDRKCNHLKYGMQSVLSQFVKSYLHQDTPPQPLQKKKSLFTLLNCLNRAEVHFKLDSKTLLHSLDWLRRKLLIG